MTAQARAERNVMIGLTSAEFNRGRFSRWLRMLLMAFYNEEERVVADFLCRRAALLRDTFIAEALGLPERQVRQVLERRLLPDCLVERQTEGEGLASKSFYRISSVAAAVAARRLQTLEESLSNISEDQYECPKCHRVYDSLQAIALAARRRKTAGMAFACEDCEEELAVLGESREIQVDRLQRFRIQCRELLVLTREMKDMEIPLFSHEEPAKQPSAKVARINESAEPPAGNASTAALAQAALESPIEGTANTKLPEQAMLDDWLRQEVLGLDSDALKTEATIVTEGAVAEKGAEQHGKRAGVEAEVQEALRQVQKEHMQESIRQALNSGNRPSSAAIEDKGAGTQADTELVTVQGKPYPLARVCSDDDLQDRMTDAEYQSFVDLARKLRRLGRPVGLHGAANAPVP